VNQGSKKKGERVSLLGEKELLRRGDALKEKAKKKGSYSGLAGQKALVRDWTNQGEKDGSLSSLPEEKIKKEIETRKTR